MTLEEVRILALALPETTEQPHFDYTSFRVKGKIFATAPPDGQRVYVFVPEAFAPHAHWCAVGQQTAAVCRNL